MKIALLGNGMGTRSSDLHRAIAKAIGAPLEFEVKNAVRDTLAATVGELLNSYDGFFVTKPYKNDISRFIGNKSGSVNVVRSRDRKAFNTDGAGFVRALDRNFIDWRTKVKSAVVLGAGGGAYAVTKELIALGKKVFVLNRTLKHALRLSTLGAELYTNQPAELIINCTPLGTYGEDALKTLCVQPYFDYAFDLVYTDDTPFLRRIRALGGQTANGSGMLIYQAIEGARIITDGDFDIEDVYEKVRAELGGRL
ncbi:MAG: hypothetical protein HDT28_02520 [Clostridiales bacterium]|nr:hypothetical protein [Clostridiales bacterium]